MKKLLLAVLIALFANASEIDLLKVATDGKVSGKSYVVAQNEAKNAKAGWYYLTWYNTYRGVGSYYYNLNTKSGYSSSRASIFARYFGSWYWGRKWR